ncbi:hypothetical protein C5B90_06325 [Haloferax sp. Atlit-12N]|nr:hypothetical protein C5B90_06325 [Haloferax sp. Atlit-12N]
MTEENQRIDFWHLGIVIGFTCLFSVGVAFASLFVDLGVPQWYTGTLLVGSTIALVGWGVAGGFPGHV